VGLDFAGSEDESGDLPLHHRVEQSSGMGKSSLLQFYCNFARTTPSMCADVISGKDGAQLVECRM
jgi:hypothetical protein